MQPSAPAQRRLDVWYVCDLSLCNFDCAYCASGSPEKGGFRTRKKMWLDEDSPARFKQILQWISALPYSIGMRLQTIGEPFVSEEFLAEAARMTREPNIRFVELVTNGSLLSGRLGKMIDQQGADPSKLSMWITYHPTEISAEKLVENAAYAQSRGVFVVVNALLFPDTLEGVEKLHALCAEKGLRTNVDLGQDFNETYSGQPFIPLAHDYTRQEDPKSLAGRAQLLIQNRQMALTSVVATAAPRGLKCSAGYDYIFISPDGEVHPCFAYRRYLEKARLGSALDPAFVPQLRSTRYAPCGIAKGCTCKEDFLHLEVVPEGPMRDRSLGYWPPAQQGTLPPIVLERLEQIRQTGALEDADFWKRHLRGESSL